MVPYGHWGALRIPKLGNACIVSNVLSRCSFKADFQLLSTHFVLGNLYRAERNFAMAQEEFQAAQNV
jgi:hypothetical protein